MVPDHPIVAMALNNLAAVFIDEGKYAEAEAPLIPAQTIQEKVLGPNNPDLALTLGNLALNYSRPGSYDRAAAFQVRREAILEASYGRDDPRVARALDDLAGVYMSQGRYDDARKVSLQALSPFRSMHLARTIRTFGSLLIG